ncbi:MAG TPA: hypothetical protein VHD83_12930 [Puia sp.]|nr:hypothetical protein [Puia sp.]
MKQIVLWGVSLLPFLTYGQGSDPNMGIIPAPVVIKPATGKFVPGATAFVKADQGAATGTEGLPEEGYRLTVGPGKIVITRGGRRSVPTRTVLTNTTE